MGSTSGDAPGDDGHRIDLRTCGRCGSCVAVCPGGILVQAGPDAPHFRPDRLRLCVRCGHCMAICPTRSVTVEGLSYERDLFALPEAQLAGEPDAFFGLVASRRSVRSFQDRPVPRELMERIVEAVSLAPMGFPPHKTALTVVQSRELIARALPLMIDLYADLVRWIDNPVISRLLRWRVSLETYNSLREHVVPIMRQRLPELRAGTADVITRGAPAMILFHADRGASSHATDLAIALGHGLLAAHALGLGACANGLVPGAVDRSEKLRELFGIPEGHEVLEAMLLGYPRYRFRRGIRRSLASVQWI